MISADGPKNIVDSVEYIASRVWEDEQGRNHAGAVLIQEQRVFAARAVQKADARPGGYVATGGHAILPFHRFGVAKLLSDASTAGLI